ncbi:MAG: DegT/DnrJ/EryC1/StrS family aminotransferase, partial [Chlorobi bacterium]|nr:DegT/DnrJ/EryC1/StrS family aminotransferase [Chlorobiota bacterium]
KHEFIKDFSDSISKGWYILGEKVKKFETEFANYCSTDYCVGVASGLDAIFLALKALNLPKKSEVIVPSNTYIASILAIIHAGLKPVLVEPNIETYNIDPLLIQEKITIDTKAILVVHLYGKLCNMNLIKDIANKFDLKIIEDCAQAHGARYKTRLAGSFGDIGAFSFYPTKNLGCLGDGGAITTSNDKLMEKIVKLRNYGSSKKYINDLIGFNSRLDEIQAGFLSIKLKKLAHINNHKRKLAHIYLKYLKDDFIKPIVQENYFDVYHIFNIRHSKRDSLKNYLLKNNIKTEIHYPIPPHKQKALSNTFFHNQDFPISDKIHKTTLSLPISFFHNESDIYRVVDIMNKY